METLALQHEEIDQNKQLVDEENNRRFELAEIERLQKLAELEAPSRLVGDLALAAVMGGAMAHTTLLPHVETVTMEMLSGTTNYADRASNNRNN